MRRLITAAAVLLAVTAGSVTGARAGIVIPPVDPPRNPLDTPAKYLVLMVLDGARPDYFHVTPLPHVDALIKNGTEYTNAFTGVLESETPTGHATISTGSTPERSGILGFSWAENNKTFSLFNPDVVRAGVMEHIMEQADAPTIAGLYKARYPGAAVVALSGHKYYAADPLGGPKADAIMYFRGTLQKTFAPTAIPGHVPPAGVFNDPRLVGPLNKLAYGQEDDMATTLALDTFAAMHQRLTLINYPDFDWPLGHVDGGDINRKDVISLMKTFDYDLGRIETAFQQAGILKKTLFVITADHGMAPITRFIPNTVVGDAVKAAGTTTASVTRNTATYIWLTDPTKDQAVAANIMQQRDPGIQSAYYLAVKPTGPTYLPAPGSQLPARLDAANRYLLRTLINTHQPQVVVLTRKGQTASPSSSHWKADHGGATWGVQHIPLIFSGPGIRAGQTSNLPAQLMDVAPTLLTDMGVRPVGMQGHVLTEALSDPYLADEQHRAAELQTITPVVQALEAEDAAESRHG